MKPEDIKTYELGDHCFGPILRVNDVDYEDINESDIISFINNMMENDINKSNLIKELFQSTIEYLQYDMIENSSDRCDSCGNYNTYAKFERYKD
jgi:hypothetical protein